ncbi:MAG: hypothetical protein MJD61_16550 [Proteobacteria bacterium]|nr:hypothetical protein [Pseudomonadota bacterium]
MPEVGKQDPMALLRVIHARSPELADLLDDYAYCCFRWHYERSYDEGSRAEVELRDKRDKLLQLIERKLSGSPAEQSPPIQPTRNASLGSWLEEKGLQLISRRLASDARRQLSTRETRARRTCPWWWPFGRR